MKLNGGYLIVWGVLGAAGGLFLLFWTLWFAGGAAGAVLFVTLLAAPGALWWLIHEVRKANAVHRAEAEAERRAAWLAQYPADARPMIDRLEHPVQAAMAWASIGLGRLPDPTRYGPSDLGEAPRLVAVRETMAGVEIDVVPHWGVNLTHIKRAAGQLAWALGAPEVRILGSDPHHNIVTLEASFRDPVASVVKAPRPEEPVDLYALRIGVRAVNGGPWRIPLMERNILVAGSMGSGKSGIMRSLVLATAPAARDGLVRNIGIDLKFGIEMRQMEGLIHEVATTATTARAKLQRMLKVVEDRGAEMEAAGVDKHTPTPDAPLWNLIIDELAELLDDPDARSEILSLMRHIMRPGRALGVSISAFTQSPEKENIASVRNLFQIRIGLRLTEESMLPMLYGGDAKERGAGNTMLADEGTQGIAFVAAEGGREIERVRAYWVPGEMLAAAAKLYPIYRHPDLEPSTKKALSDTSATGDAPAALPAPAKRKPGQDAVEFPVFPEASPRRTVVPFERTGPGRVSQGTPPADPIEEAESTGTE